MKPIGGFFELEVEKRTEYHGDAVKLNTGRNALEYIFRVKKYRKVYLPYYVCDSVIEPIIKLGLKYEFYNITHDFEPVLDKEISTDEVVLYVNYFGVNDENVKYMAKKYNDVIVDNTQAFYSRPIEKIDTVYSPRKFFGVSDGGYLYTDTFLKENLPLDVSWSRFSHLLKRAELGPEAAYSDFRKNSEELKNQSIHKMSKLTKMLLSSIKYEEAKKIREKNFKYLHTKLGKYNELSLDIDNLNGPMVYPFLINKKGLKEKLIREKIYVATYWKDVLQRVSDDSFEAYLVDNLVPLPIDQRYGEKDLARIWDILGGEIL